MATQQVFVDLDLNGNALLDVKAADAPEKAPNWGQVQEADDLKADKSVKIIGGKGLAGEGTLGSDVTIDLAVAPNGGLVVDDSGVWINDGVAIESDERGVNVKTGEGITTVNDKVEVDEAWLGEFIEMNAANNIEAGDGVSVSSGTGAGGADVISVKLAAGDNAAQVGPDGLFVDNLQQELTAETQARIAGDQTAYNGIDALTTALVSEAQARVAADADLQAQIDAEETARAQADAALESKKADKAIQITSGAGLSGGGDLSGNRQLRVNAGTGIVIASNAVAVNQDWLASQIVDNASVVEGGDGITFTPNSGTNGADVVAVKVSADSDNAVAIGSDGGVFTPNLQQEVTAANDARIGGDTELQRQIDGVVNTIIPAEAAARQSGDAALSAQISAITVTGTGMATASESEDGQFVVHVEALELANTYTGTTGVDSGTINTDIAPAVGQPGDLYINTDAGRSFISSGGDPAQWTELSSAAVGIDSISSSDGSIAIANPAGPNTNVALNPQLKTEISNATIDNNAQDARLDQIDTAQAAQDDRLDGIDTAQAAQDARMTAIEGVNTAQDGAIAGLQNTKADKSTSVLAGSGLSGGGQLTGDVTLNVALGADSGLSVDAGGLFVDTGEALERTADGIAVKSGDGLAVGGADGDTLVVQSANAGISVGAAGVGVVVDPNVDNLLKLGDAGLYVANRTLKYVTTVAGAGPHTVTHNLGNADITVSVWVDGCLATASVCSPTATTVTIDGNFGASSAKVVVIG